MTTHEQLRISQLPSGERERLSEYYYAGYDGAKRSESREEHPFGEDSLEAISWRAGWDSYFKDNA